MMDALAPPREISFVVPGEVAPWARAGRGGAVTFTPAKQRDYMAALRTIAAASMRGAPPLDGPIELQVKVTYLRPKSHKRNPPKWKTSRPDIDNAAAKLVMDSLNKLAWVDDAQIASLHCWKLYADRAELAVVIRALA